MLHRFYGGIHPNARKKATSGVHTQTLATPPAKVMLAVTEPLVSVGDHVDVGARLCDAYGKSAAVHASVSGVVTAIEPRMQANGREALCVILGNDTLDTQARPGRRSGAEELPNTIDPQRIREAISLAGIAGMGGAGFPTDVKLANALGKVDTLIINGCECESYLTADHRLLLERSGDVLTGARLLARALELDRAVLAVEGDKYDAVTALRALLPLRGGDMEIKVLRTRYPQGSEKQLIQRLTGRKVPPRALPMEVGCAVFNVATCAAVYDAVYEGRPLTHRIVTVTGSAARKPKNLLVPLGTPIQHLIDEAGGWSEHPERVLAGGGMMGVTQTDLTAPVNQGTAAVVALTRKDTKLLTRPEGECIRCGKCVEVCPMCLEPVYLRLYARAGRPEELRRLHITDCMECGACAYACPARLKLVGDIRGGKQLLQEQGRGERHE